MAGKKFKVGTVIRTNEKFAKIIGNKEPIAGTLVRQSIGGKSWWVRLDGFVKLQQVHERMMEVK